MALEADGILEMYQECNDGSMHVWLVVEQLVGDRLGELVTKPDEHFIDRDPGLLWRRRCPWRCDGPWGQSFLRILHGFMISSVTTF